MTQHSFLSPSGAAAWQHCALWPTMAKLYPQDDTPQTLEGDAAHWVCAEFLYGRRAIVEGSKAPNGEIVTGEMLDGAELYADTVNSKLIGNDNLHVEEFVTIPIWEYTGGTPDAWSYRFSSNVLRIWDYKFGHGYISHEFNPQGMLYALGILEKLKAEIVNPLLVQVSFTIVQPRCFYKGAPVRTHTYRFDEAADRIMALRTAAHRAHDAQPVATTNPECDYCPGRHACSALQHQAYRAAEFADNRLPLELTPSAAALELRKLEHAYERLGARVDGLREQTLANIKAGKQVRHYRVEQGRGRRQWNMPNDQVIAMGTLMGKDITKVSLITPTQAEKLLPSSVIDGYSQHVPGAPKLIPQDNTEASRVFGQEE